MENSITRTKKLSCSLALVVALSLFYSSTCFAAYWHTMTVNTTTKSYISSTFENEGDILVDFIIYQSNPSNDGSIELQRLDNGKWTTAWRESTELKVNAYTYFGGNERVGTGTFRLVWRSTYNAALNGNIKYFS